MKPAPRSTTGMMNLTGYSLRATWLAVCAIPTDHFPLILPAVHPVAAFFILRRLKRLGFSDCRVVSSEKGLVVHAHR
ncbi:MAG: hypothetical protein H7X83_05125 [Verrucomicrobia bacterium]|nr:hypothetical protein [Deltaproteobacteria bacterium]